MPLKATNANKAARPSRKSKDGKENTDDKPEQIASTQQSRKRRASDENDGKNGDDATSQFPSVKEDDCFSIEYDCDEIRDKIREHLEQNKVKITAFQKKLGVTSTVYKSFMSQPNGPGNGLKNKTYAAAHQFFTQQDSNRKSAKSPASKKRKTEGKTDDSKSSDSDVINTDDLPKLDGESDGSVQVYDPCNDVRTKIEAHLKKHKLTKVAFAREISKCQGSGGTAVTLEQVTAFQRKNGPLAGNSTKTFYANYVYFEKLRIKEGKDKSEKRQEMEDVHGDRGVMTDRAIESIHFKLPRGRKVYIDKYGKPRNSDGTW